MDLAVHRRSVSFFFGSRAFRCGLFALICLCQFASVGGTLAEGPKLDEQVLKKVKHATVHLRVKLANGSTVQGSGWFAVEPGLVVTNAHVLGMLDADSRRPQLIEAEIDGGEAASRTLKAQLLGVDRNSDLAVLRCEGKDLPEPLSLGSTAGLSETQAVYVFGFPLGKELGKSITVNQSSVSSLRKEKGELTQIQVNGGIHPGNSGGPVADASGQVVGVSVQMIAGTTISFAIPSEKVQSFFNGRVSEVSAELAVRDGDKTKIPVRIGLVDPLSRVKKLSLEYFVAPIAKVRIREGSANRPEPQPGDGPIQTIDVEYDGKGSASVEAAVTILTDPKVSYWFRPVYVNGAGQTTWYRAIGGLRPNPVDRKPATVKFGPKAGKAAPVEMTDDSSFQVRTGSEKPQTLAMHLKVIMNPTVRDTSAAGSTNIDLAYSSFTIGMKVNGEPVHNDANWRTLGQNMLKTTAGLEFENDGTILRAQPDLSKAAKDQKQSVSEISEHLLQALEFFSVPLPNDTIQPASVIRAQRNLSVGLPGMLVPAQISLRYQYLGTRAILNGRPVALFDVTGTVRGRRGEGLDVGGKATGKIDVSLETGQVLQANCNVKVDLELADAGKPMRLSGTLGLKIHPAPPPKKPVANDGKKNPPASTKPAVEEPADPDDPDKPAGQP